MALRILWPLESIASVCRAFCLGDAVLTPRKCSSCLSSKTRQSSRIPTRQTVISSDRSLDKGAFDIKIKGGFFDRFRTGVDIVLGGFGVILFRDFTLCFPCNPKEFGVVNIRKDEPENK